MRCARIKLTDGTVAIICGHTPASATSLCAFCRQPSTKLCDFPTRGRTGRRKPCDAPICNSCATSLGPNSDLCPAHAAEWQGLPVVRLDQRRAS
jgi:hypothetical protein